ncbi:MAG: hypothetical protein ACFFDH_16070 [Promethearchaeota archaeon]
MALEREKLLTRIYVLIVLSMMSFLISTLLFLQTSIISLILSIILFIFTGLCIILLLYYFLRLSSRIRKIRIKKKDFKKKVKQRRMKKKKKEKKDESEKFCPFCKEYIVNSGSHYCSKCGSPLEK